ncbi:MAG TPA: helix-turn-helix domain-containing protein [Bacilli bacterium]|nr:helix-turn-helix domain-containing protein [Bacilli bacterium]
MTEYRDATLGDLLRERRTTLGMTMREVAGSTLSPTAVNNIEKGKIRPTIETVLYLCDVLGLQPEQALIFYPDLSKSISALFEVVNRKLEAKKTDESIALLYDMYWVATEQPDHENLIALIQMKIASVFGDHGRFESARDGMNEAYKYFLIHKDIPRQIEVLNSLGDYALAEFQRSVALSYYKQAVELGPRYHVTDTVVGESYCKLAHIHFLDGKMEEALRLSRAAEAVFRAQVSPDGEPLEDGDGIARCALQQASILIMLDEVSDALATARSAYDHFQATDNRPHLGRAARVLGDVLRHCGDSSAARDYYHQAYRLKKVDAPAHLHNIERRLVELELSLGRIAEARRLAEEALARLEDPYQCSRFYKLLAQCDFQSRNIDGYIVQMNHAVAALKEAGIDYAAALVQCELADVTNDFNLMREATRILRNWYGEYTRYS